MMSKHKLSEIQRHKHVLENTRIKRTQARNAGVLTSLGILGQRVSGCPRASERCAVLYPFSATLPGGIVKRVWDTLLTRD